MNSSILARSFQDDLNRIARVLERFPDEWHIERAVRLQRAISYCNRRGLRAWRT